MVKEKILIFILVISGILLNAQEGPFNSQYLFNMLQINPAYSGTNGDIDVLASTKLQWAGLEGAPTTHTLSANTLLGSSNIGAGLSVLYETIGPFKNLRVAGDLSYHVQVSRDSYLSLGTKVGFINYALNLDQLEITDNTDNFLQGNSNETLLNIGFGAFYFSKKFYAGISLPQYLEGKIILSESAVFDEPRNLYVCLLYTSDAADD